MSETIPDLPAHYRDATRVILKFAIVMAILGLLLGVAYQESVKKLEHGDVDPGFRLQVTIHLALVHGHVLLIGTILPLVLVGMLFLARKAGGTPVSSKSVRWLTRGYLPFSAATFALMLYKGYHFLLAARAGGRSVAEADASFFGGSAMIRHSVYGLFHAGMGIAMIVFLVAVWRSLRDGGKKLTTMAIKGFWVF
jgi:hypothetical protein